MECNNDIIEFISKNKEQFQVSLSLVEKIKKSNKKNRINTGRMININKYQTNGVLIDHFYKKISRVIL
jgi:hypothetical protein